MSSLMLKTPTVLSVIQSVSTGNPLSRQQIKFIEDNAMLLIEFRPRDYCVKDQLTSRQELMMEHAAEALLIERAVAPIDAGHAFTTIGYSIANQNHFVEAKNRFLPKLFMIQDAIREKGLWPVWNLIKGESEE